MHPCIHVCIIIQVQKENHNMACIIKSSIILHKIIECQAFTWCLSTLQKQNLDSPFIHQDPLRSNGHRSLYIKTLCKAMVTDFLCHIEALCEAMVIDLFTSRPSARQWSLISFSHRGPLQGYGHRSLYIKTLCEAMVIDFFVTSRPSAKQWSLIYFLLIQTLSSELV